MEIWKLVEERKNYLRVFEEKSANCHQKKKISYAWTRQVTPLFMEQRPETGSGSDTETIGETGVIHLAETALFNSSPCSDCLCRISTFLTANALHLAFQTLPRLYTLLRLALLLFILFTLSAFWTLHFVQNLALTAN